MLIGRIYSESKIPLIKGGRGIFIKTFLHVFGFLGILFIPFPFYIFPFQQGISGFIFKPILVFISETVFSQKLINPELSSDSKLMYLLILVLMGLAFLVVALIKTFEVFQASSQKTSKVFFVVKTSEVLKTSDVYIKKILRYYLALQLLKYGIDKLFKSQFYLPEPNILFTPFGQLDKDILYWSTMGISHSYNVFLGIMEVLAAGLILVNKTRVTGLLLALGILINVVAINFSFDISVKIFSCFLLFLSLVLLAPQISGLYQFFILQKNTSLQPEPIFTFKNPVLKPGLKILAILLIFTEALFPYFKTKNLNDDLAQRPFLHGAYMVINNPDFKRFFIHRDGYIIFQNTSDEMQDYKLEMDTINNEMVFTDYTMNQTKHGYKWNPNDSILKIQLGKNILEAKAIDWKKLPVLQTQFHWTID